MIKLILFVALLGLIAFGAAWLADQPGHVSFILFQHQVETKPIVLLGALVALVVLCFVGLGLLKWLWLSPRNARKAMAERNARKGREAIERGILAIGAGDLRAAQSFSSQADRFASSSPLTLLLRAQTHQLAGQREGAEKAFRAMIERSDTRALGLRGLYIEAQRRQDGEAQRAIAQEAVKTSPTAGWAAQAVLDDQSASGDWDAALASLSRNIANRLTDRETGRRHKAVLLTAKAMALETDSPAEARKLAGEAHNLAPDLVPAAVLLARLLGTQGEARKAAKALEVTWRHQPHPELADTYAGLRPGETSAERMKRMGQLVGLAVSHPESAMALARAAIQANDFASAREALSPWTAEAPSQRLCLLMAEICSKDGNDLGRAREWMARALRAPRDPVWTADGQVSDRWLPFSPVSGRLDAFEWKVPLAEIGGPVLHVDDVLADANEPVTRASPVIVIDNAPPPQEEPSTEPVPAPVIDETYTPPLPDDPGPSGSPAPKKRFSLFGR